MKTILIYFCLVLCLILTGTTFSKAAGELTGIQYRNITVANDGKSFSMEIWAYAVEPGYTTAATPWSSFTIRMDLTLVGGATDIGALGPENITSGLATSGTLTSNPPGGIAPKLGITLNRGTSGGELTTTAQRLATIVIPVSGGTGTITSASVAETRPSSTPPLSTESYWTSTVSPTTRRALIVPQETPLPVSLSYFQARPEGSSAVQLNWTTTSETNTKQFDVERSADSKHWNTIGVKTSAGHSDGSLQYSFTDNAPLSGINYYRLKMVDQDKKYALSGIQSVHMKSADQNALSVYPNPTSNQLYLHTANLTGLKQIAIMAANGAMAYKSTSYTAEGIDVSSLSSGNYIVKITHSDGSKTHHRFIVTR